MTDIILHHYAISPFAEKARLALGLKRLAWRSVTVPLVMPKPDLVPLTGGYRRTPVMQIGADIYCDTLCILRELERRVPEPSLFPGDPGLALPLAWWADRPLFMAAVGVIFAGLGDRLPETMREDRARFLGRDFDPIRMQAARPRIHDAMRSHLGWLEDMLSDGRRFLLGEAPGMADLAAYHPIWFLRTHGRVGRPFLDPLTHIAAWADRVAEIGHGEVTEMTAAEALDIAKASEPATPTAQDSDDPVGRRPGDRVQVTPDDYGFDPVVGELVASSRQEVVIRRQHPRIGEVMVHFPREGFVVAPEGTAATVTAPPRVTR